MEDNARKDADHKARIETKIDSLSEKMEIKFDSVYFRLQALEGR